MSYLEFVTDAVMMVLRLAHSPTGYPPRCATCGTRWPCDRLRRLDEIDQQHRDGDAT